MRTTLHHLLLACTLLCAVPAFAQVSSFTVIVLDSATAAPVPGASLAITDLSRSATAGDDGRATFTDMPDGAHTLRAAAIGYLTRNVAVHTPLAGTLTLRLRAADEELPETEIAATRTGSRIGDEPQKIEVIGADDLLEEGSLVPGNVASLIGDISSVQVQQISAVNGASQVRMQGLQGRHTLLLRDGLPAYGGISGGFDLLRLPPLDLERVEVLKGPSSTFNGGGAIAGAIDFVTKHPTDSLTALVMTNGSTLGGTNANVYVSGPLGKAGFTLFAGRNDAPARDVDGDGWTDVPEQHQTQVHPQLFLKPWTGGTVRVGLLAQTEERKGGHRASLDALTDTSFFVQHLNSQRLATDVIAEQRIDAVHTLTLKGSIGRYWSTERSTEAPEAPQVQQDNAYAEAYWKAHTERQTLVLGANYWGMRLLGANGFTVQDLGTIGAFGQLALHRAKWPTIELGLRVDHNDRFGTFALPAVAALFKPGTGWSLRGSIGTGYQLPDRTQPYTLTATAEAVPALRAGTQAERSTGGTLEWTRQAVLGGHTSLTIDQTFFLTRIDDPLTITADALLANAGGHVRTAGIDNYMRIKHDEAELYLGYTWTVPEAIDGAVHTRVPYTPEHRAAVTLAYELGAHWRTGVEAAYSGPQTRYDGSDTREQWSAAAMVGYHTGAWTVVLNGENLFDVRQTRYEPVVLGAPAHPVFVPLWAPIDGRVLNLSLLWHFGGGR